MPVTDRQVRRRSTPATLAQMAGGLARAWSEETQTTPTIATLRVLASQVVAEVGWHAAGLWNYNAGNIRHTPSTGPWYELRGGRWRSYRTIDAGARSLVRLLRGRYPVAAAAAAAGNVEAYAAALAEGGYVGPSATDRASYRKLIAGVHRLMIDRLPDTAPGEALASSGAYAPPPELVEEPTDGPPGPTPMPDLTSARTLPIVPILGLGVAAALARSLVTRPRTAVGIDLLSSHPEDARRTFDVIEDLRGDYIQAANAQKVTREELRTFGDEYNRWGEWWRSVDSWISWHLTNEGPTRIRLQQFRRRFEELRAVLLAKGAAVRSLDPYQGPPPDPSAPGRWEGALLQALPIALLAVVLFGGGSLLRGIRGLRTP